jgi:lysozyme family protein
MNNYWMKINGDALPSGVDFSVFDMAVNAGDTRSVQILQREVLIPVAQQDGIIGPMTLAAVAKILPTDLVGYLASGQLRFYKSLTNLFPTFGKGWTNRTNLRYHMAYALAMTGSMGPICKAM